MKLEISAPRRVGGVWLLDQDPDTMGMSLKVLGDLDPDWRIHRFAVVATALDRVARLDSPPDLLIVDPSADQGTGIRLVRAMRDRFDSVPVLVLTADSSATLLFESIRAGATGYLLKDRDADLLGQAITDVLDGAHPVSPALGRHLFSLAGAGRVDSGNPSSAEAIDSLRLSAREKELLKHLSRGSSYAEAASVMGVVLSTVQSHVRRLYRKLDVRSRMQAVNVARANGLI